MENGKLGIFLFISSLLNVKISLTQIKIGLFMKEYSLTIDRKNKRKRIMSIFLAVQYLIFIGIVFKGLLNNPNTTIILIFVAIILIFVFFYFYNCRKYYDQVDNTKLVIDNTSITLYVPKLRDRSIYLDDIREVNVKKSGFEIISKNSSKKSLFISNGFEDFDEIERVVHKYIS